MDEQRLRAVRRVQTAAVVSGVLRRFLRWRALRHEGGVARHRARVAAADVPQLVSCALPIRLRDVPLCARTIQRAFEVSLVNGRVSARPAAFETSTSQFAQDVRYYLSLTPRQLPSRYLYDPLGSALFDAICRLPWYHLTRAELQLLTERATEIFTALRPVTRIVELGSGSGEKLR